MTKVAGLALAGCTGGLLCGCHFLWFGFFGPPARWGANVVSKTPLVMTDLPPALVSSLKTVGPEGESDSLKSLPQDLPALIRGTPFHYDNAPSCGLAVLQTHVGRLWGEDQHTFVRWNSSSDWTEAIIPSHVITSSAAIVCTDAHASVLVVRWNPWWPYSYRRFLRSLMSPSLRSEYGVYRLNPDSGDLQFLFPGYGLLPSPDHKYVAYLTSANGFSGFHNILVYKAKEARWTRVLSLWEADPGSGTSFSYRWSDDSRALIITGQARGWESLAAVSTDLHLAFLPETDELFDSRGQKANNRMQLTVTTLACARVAPAADAGRWTDKGMSP